jgi:hypothetical protein
LNRAGIKHPQRVHGIVFVPQGVDMTNLSLEVDLDGNDLDANGGAVEDHSATLSPADSNRLIRKIVSAVWKASQKTCGNPCYTTTNPPGTDVFDSTLNLAQISSDGTQTGNLTSAINIIAAYGAIQTTDVLSLTSLSYAGRFTLFLDDPTGSLAEVHDNVVSLEAHQSSGKWYSFPCQHNMGILASDDLDMEPAPHSRKVGAFYAGNSMYVEKQLRVLGAMVADEWDFSGGGNPDLFQAMEMKNCLPPYMIGDKTVPYLSTTTFVER